MVLILVVASMIGSRHMQDPLPFFPCCRAADTAGNEQQAFFTRRVGDEPSTFSEFVVFAHYHVACKSAASAMSGFEVAGIVLGAFPIALEALKQYEVVKTQIRLWRKIQEEYVDCKDEILFQQLCYEDSLRDLLAAAAIDEDIAKDLTADPASEHWKDPSVMALLSSEYFEPFVKCIRAMDRTMGQINREMGVDSTIVQEKLSGMVSQLSYSVLVAIIRETFSELLLQTNLQSILTKTMNSCQSPTN
jgi:hypothetical protein